MSLLVPILMYHRVAIVPKGAPGAELAVPPAEFAAQIEWLRARGRAGVALRELAEALAGGKALPRRAVVLTFDDGNCDVFESALSVLERAGFGATIFPSSGLLGGRDQFGAELAGAEALRQAAAAGFEIASHGATHRDLTEISDAELEPEVTGSRAELGRLLGREPATFAYPFGAFDARVCAAVERAGYRAAVTVAGGVLHRPAGRFRLRRVAVYPGLTPERFGRRLGLLYEAHQRLARIFGPRNKEARK